MMRRKSIPIPGVGSILQLLSLILLVVGFIFYFACWSAFGYGQDRFVIAFTILAIWVSILMLATDFFDAKRPIWVASIGLVYCFFVLFSFGRILAPCISPIGILFTVNMGDMETYAIGVPRCFVSIGGYLLSALFFVASSFFGGFQHQEEEQ